VGVGVILSPAHNSHPNSKQPTIKSPSPDGQYLFTRHMYSAHAFGRANTSESRAQAPLAIGQIEQPNHVEKLFELLRLKQL